MRKLNLLFNTSPGAFKDKGGGEVQLLETKAELESMGNRVSILEELGHGAEFSGFDVFHNFNLHRDNWPFIMKAKKEGLPIAVSTIYWPSLSGALRWNSGMKKAKGFAAELSKRADVFGISKVKKIVKVADVLLPNSEAEARGLQKVFSTPKEKIYVVPNGVEERFRRAKPGPFEKKYGLQDFVLYVGRIEERKNVLGLIRAMKGLDEKLVVIGNAKQGSEAYYQKCRSEAGGDAIFLGAIEHESKMLESAYAACRVFALPSWYETPGLAALEAGLAGANLVVTREGCTAEYFGERAGYVNPGSVGDIREKLLAALGKPGTGELQQHILKNFLWKNAAGKTMEAYEKII